MDVVVLCFLALLISACSNGGGEPMGTLTVTVLNEKTEEPLAGATVEVLGQEDELTTNDGQVEFTVSSGILTIEVRKEGYETRTLPVSAPGTVDVELRPILDEGTDEELRQIVNVLWDGDDAGDGSIEAPVQSLVRAQELVADAGEVRLGTTDEQEHFRVDETVYMTDRSFSVSGGWCASFQDTTGISVLEAPENGPILDIENATEAVRLTGLHFQSGSRSAVAVFDSDVVITDCIFSDNQAGVAQDGGAVRANGGMLTISESTFRDNRSFDRGGALFFTGMEKVALIDVVFDSNIVDEGQIFEERGGAVYGRNSMELRVEDGWFEGNEAKYGAGLYVLDVSFVKVTDSTFLDNAQGGIEIETETAAVNSVLKDIDWINNNGGGLTLYGRTSLEVEVTDATFSGNEGARGGAVSASRGGVDTVFRDVEFLKNKASFEGGAVRITDEAHVQFERCLFQENEASDGGAVAVSRAWQMSDARQSATFKECQFLDNRALGGGDLGGYGGAVFGDNADLVVTGAVGEEMQYAFERNTAERGGAVYLYQDTEVDIRYVAFLSNEAENQGGGLWVSSSATVNNDISSVCLFDGNAAEEEEDIYYR